MQQTRAAVFDSIGAALEGAVLVDLFAGAGSVGIEAASRGAAFVHFVENDCKALEFLEVNIAACRLADRSAVHPVSVFAFLEDEQNRSIEPDIVYADPPYEGEDPATLLAILDSLRYSHPCLIVFEHRRDLPVEECLNLERTKIKKFGRTWVSFFVPMGGDER